MEQPVHIRNIDEATLKPVEMAGVQGAHMAVMCGKEHGAMNFSLRRFRIDAGGYTPRHSHDYEHEVFIVDGGGTVLLDGKENPVRPGDVILVPANEEHQFKADSRAGLSFLCMVPGTRNCGEPTPGS